MIYHDGSGARQVAFWGAGVAFGLFVLCVAGLMAVAGGKPVDAWVLMFLFGAAASSVPTLGLLIMVLDGVANSGMDSWERYKRLKSDAAGDAAVTLEESDPLADEDERANEYWADARDNLLEFLDWCDWLGSLTGPDHVRAKSVPSLKEWGYYTDILAASGMVIKRNGEPTIWHPNYSPLRASLKIQRGEFTVPDGSRRPPRVAPCPAVVIVEHQEPNTQPQADKGSQRLQKAA